MDAGKDIHAFANSASSLSKTGEPIPAGTFRAITSTTPPILFPVRLQSIAKINHKNERILDDVIFIARSLGFLTSKSKNGIFIIGNIDEIPCKKQYKSRDHNS